MTNYVRTVQQIATMTLTATGSDDTITLSNGGTADFSVRPIYEVEHYKFSSAGNTIQLRDIQMDQALGFEGGAGSDRIEVSVERGGSLDLHDKTFTNWGSGGDLVVIDATNGVTTIVGSDVNDEI